MNTATYVYCLVAATRRPKPPRKGVGLPKSGPVRVLDVDRNLFLVAADVPLSEYGEDAIARDLGDLDWVSRVAVAHETVVESFAGETAVLPMKLFTMFTTDERAVAHVRADRARIAAAVKRVANHAEWGVRVVLDRARTGQRRQRGAGDDAPAPSGVAYLTRKKAQRDAAFELAENARETVASLYDRLSAKARVARKRSAADMPVQGGPLLLDAAFLVPRSRTRSFESQTRREVAALARHGYQVTVTGPWPPYSFVQD